MARKLWRHKQLRLKVRIVQDLERKLHRIGCLLTKRANAEEQRTVLGAYNPNMQRPN